MKRQTFALVLALLWGLPLRAHAQQKPDFTGVWLLDTSRSERGGVYGQIRVITQTATEIDLTVLHYAGHSKDWNVIPWRFRIDRWGPRRGGERSREPVVQARWDRDKVIAVKSPGQSYSVLWIWTLVAGGNEMLVEAVNWTQIPSDFDFREASVPAAYARSKYVYVRRPGDSCADCFFAIDEQGVHADVTGQAVAFQLTGSVTEVAVMCRTTECAFIEIVSGRRDSPRKRAAGGIAKVALSSQTVIEVAK
jgi:hypothetical protein